MSSVMGIPRIKVNFQNAARTRATRKATAAQVRNLDSGTMVGGAGRDFICRSLDYHPRRLSVQDRGCCRLARAIRAP